MKNMELKKELLDFLEANNNFGLIEGLVEGIVDTYISAYKECNKSLNEQKMSEQSAVEWLFAQMSNVSAGFVTELNELEMLQQAKEMEKEQRGYSEEDVRLAYFQGEKDSYIKGGQTKEMENEFIQSLKQKHELNKSE